jgi:hypothetical protein
MTNRSGSILTRGRSSIFFRSGVAPFTSGFILQITETPVPAPIVDDVGGRSGRRSEYPYEEPKRLKRITVTVYINNKEYSESHIVDENIKIKVNDVLIE